MPDRTNRCAAPEDLVVFAQGSDPHVDAVLGKLSRETSVKVVDRYSPSAVAFDPSRTDRHRAKVFWYRMKRNSDVIPRFFFDDAQREEHFLTGWQNYCRGLEDLADIVLHRDPVTRRANRKMFQLRAAQAVGLRTPRTLVSNDCDAIAETFSGSEKILAKPLSSTSVKRGRATYAASVTLDYIMQNREPLSFVPYIFQSYVEKEYELRVSVVGNEVFAARINSQEIEGAEVDWRIRQAESGMFEPIGLHDDLSALLTEYCRHLDIEYGVFDLVVTPTGQNVFLECNLDGQWLFVERYTGLPISKAYANLLERKVEIAGR